MRMLMTKLILLATFLLNSCVEEAPKVEKTSGSVLTVQSSSYTNDGSVATSINPQVDKILSLFVSPALAAIPITDFKFCITKMKIVTSGGSGPSAQREARLGLVDLSDASATTEWGTVELEEGTQIDEVHFEVHKDAQGCSGADYSVSYNGQKLSQDLEFKFKFSPALVANHGDTINLKFGVIAKAIEDARAANQFTDENITKYLQANTIGTGEEL